MFLWHSLIKLKSIPTNLLEVDEIFIERLSRQEIAGNPFLEIGEILNFVIFCLKGIHYIGEMQHRTLQRTLFEQISDGQVQWQPLEQNFDTVCLFEVSPFQYLGIQWSQLFVYGTRVFLVTSTIPVKLTCHSDWSSWVNFRKLCSVWV